MDDNEPLDPKLFELAVAAVEEGIRQVRELTMKNRYISQHYDWPAIAYSDSGLPRFYTSHYQNPV